MIKYMDKKASIVFIQEKDNKYSTHVLVAALEGENTDNVADIFITNLRNAEDILTKVSSKYRLKILAYPLLTVHVVENLERIRSIVILAKKLGYVTLAGGPHATGDPYGTIISLGFDYVALGEGEDLINEFVINYAEGNDVKRINGVVFMEDGKIKIKGRRWIRDLDMYPPISLRYRLFNPIEITRGCVYACKYCQVSFMFTTKLRHRSVESITYYSSMMVKEGLKDLRFISPDSLSYGSRGYKVNYDALANLLESLNTLRRNEGARVFLGTFPSEVRPEHVDENIARLFKGRIDNKRIIIGAQTGSDKLLKKINRGHTSDDVIHAVEVLRRYDFEVDVDYIFGLPGEDDEDILLTMKHIEKLVSLGARIHAHVFMPLPGTPFSFAPPGKIRPEMRRFLYKLLGKGIIYGQWRKQEDIAYKIAKLRDEGVILISERRAYEVLNTLNIKS